MRFWNGEDGTVQMRGAFDAEMGARIQSRIRDEAEHLRQADRRRQRGLQSTDSHDVSDESHAFGTTVPDDGVHDGAARSGDATRTLDQRMADALDRILINTAPVHGPAVNGTAVSDVHHVCAATGGEARGRAASDDTSNADTATGCGSGRATSDGTQSGDGLSAGHKNAPTQLIVRADLEDLLGEHGGIGEVAGTGPVPGSVVDRLCCNGEVSVVLFDKELNPVYEAVVSRAPTAAQRRALIARDGACIGCGAPPGECEAHHIIPWKRGGPTKIDNLVLVCWSCHDKIHDHNWQVICRRGRYRLIPPDAASAPNPAPSRKPAQSGKPAVAKVPISCRGPARPEAPALFP